MLAGLILLAGFKLGILDGPTVGAETNGAVVTTGLEEGATTGIKVGPVGRTLSSVIGDVVGATDGEQVGDDVTTVTLVEEAVFKAVLAPGILLAVACRVVVKLPNFTLVCKVVV